MSKAVIIQKDGVGQNLSLDALRTSKPGSGSEDWVPADGKNLVELDIGGSGTYLASDYNAYGISVARVYPKVGGGATSKAAQQPEFGDLHTPSIQEGGKPVILSARLLKTNLQGGGTCLWVPEDEVNLDTKYVDHSGTYTARADDCYGYSQIAVSGVDVEIKKDDDGDDVAEITDGGETREEKLPSEIRIEREPYFVGPYGDRAYISFDGLVVKAYTESGRLWTDAEHPNGVIPASELIFPVTVTDISQASGEGRATSELIDGEVVFGVPPVIVGRLTGTHTHYVGGSVAFVIAPSGSVYMASKSSFTGRVWEEWGADTTPHNERSLGAMSFTHDEKTAYFCGESYPFLDMGCNIPMIDRSIDAEYVAWTILYGDITFNLGQNIPVQWNRPYDGRLLETSFYVSVVDVGPMGGQGED